MINLQQDTHTLENIMYDYERNEACNYLDTTQGIPIFTKNDNIECLDLYSFGNHNINYLIGKPGSGKTIFHNTALLNELLLSHNDNLNIYINHFSAQDDFGLYDYIKTNTNYKVLSISERKKINPFQTIFGYNYPSQLQKDLISYFFSKESNSCLNTSFFIGNILSNMYSRIFLTPKEIESDKINNEINDYLNKIGIPLSNFNTYIELRDFLFSKNELNYSEKIHCLATPNIHDFINQLKIESPQNEVYKWMIDFVLNKCNELIDFIGISEIYTEQYNIIHYNYNTNLSNTNPVYNELLYIFLNTKLYNPYAQSNEQSMFVSYQNKKMQEHKIIVSDEFSTSSNQQIDTLLQRHGRKSYVSLTYLTQNVKEINSDYATKTLIFSNEKNNDELVNHINLNFLFTNNITLGFKQINATKEIKFYGQIYNFKQGNHIRNLWTMKLNAKELWIYASNYIDMSIKNELVKQYGLNFTLNLLCEHFPNGSAYEIYQKNHDFNKIKHTEFTDKIIQEITTLTNMNILKSSLTTTKTKKIFEI